MSRGPFRGIATAAAVVTGVLALSATSCRESVPAPPVPDNLDRADPLVVAQIHEAVNAVGRLADDPGPAWGELGRVYHANHYLDLAARCYEVADNLDANNAEWPYYLGVLAAHHGDTTAATAWFAKSIERGPEYAPARLRLGDVRLTVGDLAGAEEAFHAYVSSLPGLPWGHAALGRLAMRRGETEQAVAHLERAFDIEPAAKEIAYLLASTYRDAGRGEDAARLLEHFEERTDPIELPDPLMARVEAMATGTQVLLRKANALLARDRLEEAEGLYREVLDVAPTDFAALVNLGELYMRQRRYDDALVVLERAVSAEPGLAYGHYGLALCYLALSRREDAVTALAEVLRLDPEHAGAEAWLGWLEAGGKGPMPAATVTGDR